MPRNTQSFTTLIPNILTGLQTITKLKLLIHLRETESTDNAMVEVQQKVCQAIQISAETYITNCKIPPCTTRAEVDGK